MSDPRFFEAKGPISVAEIAELVGAHIPAGADLARRVSGVAALDLARRSDASFFSSVRFAAALAATKAGVCFCRDRDAGLVPEGTVALPTDDPHVAFARLAARLYPDAARPVAVTGANGIAAGALVDPSARLEPGVTVEAGAVVGSEVEIGMGSLIGPGAVIGPGVRIGRETVVSAHATVTNALIGNRVVIHPGVRIGQDGFGFISGVSGHMKIAQIGRVIIQDDVEIGANTTIDRGSNRDTIIGEGSKIDNLVQIGHNVSIGRHCLIAGLVGISGSVTVGDFVMMGGNAGIRDNVTIGSRAHVAAKAGVHTDIPAGEHWIGLPAQPRAVWLRELKALKRAGRVPAARPADAEGGDADG